MKTFCECTDVTFYPVDRQDLLRYIASGDPMDKAGAYGIQGDFAIHVKEIHGDYNNVVGLPVARLYQELKRICWFNTRHILYIRSLFYAMQLLLISDTFLLLR